MYSSLQGCIADLEKNNLLVRISEEMDPYLEMAAIQRKVYAERGVAVLFERVKGSRFPAVSNLFGTLDRSEFIFRDTLPLVQQLIALRKNPLAVLKTPFKYTKALIAAAKALPLKKSPKTIALFDEISIADLPQIHCWPEDGGAFITLPQVYSEDPSQTGIMHSNLGMYRIQLAGNDYIPGKEVGLHYQIHRGIGIHQSIANKQNKPLKVSIFVGGPPAHTLAAVMPLPEGMSELTFAGLLAGRRFRYTYVDGFMVSLDADFVITGEIMPNGQTKPEGPFGDHLGYYSLTHPFPVMKVHHVYAKKNAVWPFTVVGRPPQEDTSFGALIHKITGNAIQQELPGVCEVHAVDAAGVHPLLLAVGSERYTPYLKEKKPAEILTQANRILGTGQLSLAKYLFIAADDKAAVSTQNIEYFFRFVLERVDLGRDLHFQTSTTIDTLDYSSGRLNEGSKLIVAAYGEPKRKLTAVVPDGLEMEDFSNAKMAFPGVLVMQGKAFTSYPDAKEEMKYLTRYLSQNIDISGIAMVVISDDADFVAENISNFVWVTFTRSDPEMDVYGVHEKVENKHWSCDAPLIIDARIKPHQAPPLVGEEAVEKKVARMFAEGKLSPPQS